MIQIHILFQWSCHSYRSEKDESKTLFESLCVWLWRNGLTCPHLRHTVPLNSPKNNKAVSITPWLRYWLNVHYELKSILALDSKNRLSVLTHSASAFRVGAKIRRKSERWLKRKKDSVLDCNKLCDLWKLIMWPRIDESGRFGARLRQAFWLVGAHHVAVR
jgi:hypothetical protein